MFYYIEQCLIYLNEVLFGEKELFQIIVLSSNNTIQCNETILFLANKINVIYNIMLCEKLILQN